MIFSDLLELQRALETGVVEVTAKISVRMVEYHKDVASGAWVPETKLVATTVGRALLSVVS
jgi:DNA-directed RNA polymerase subunit beta'